MHPCLEGLKVERLKEDRDRKRVHGDKNVLRMKF